MPDPEISLSHLPEELLAIFATLQKHAAKAFIVGGAVRDLLLGNEVSDWDLTTSATPEQITAIFPDSFYDNNFGTVGVPTPLGVIEITTMRKEGNYVDFRHPQEIIWTKDIKEDLARRDFTINAMALAPTGELIDIFDGQADLSKKIIRAVGDPDRRFQEDALRMLKAFRLISQLGFVIEDETLISIAKNRELLKHIAWERIRDEFFKLLAGHDPYLALEQLQQTQVLEFILPEIERAFGVKQEGPKHDRIYDIGEHSLLTMKFTPTKNPLVRFAALLHDVGKPDTYQIDKNGNVTFYQHDLVGADLAVKIGKRFKLSRKQIDKLYDLVRYHLFTVDEHQTDSALRRFIKNVGIENLDDMFALREGDRLGGGTSTPTSWRLEKFKDRIQKLLEQPFSLKDLKINGSDVMKTLDIPPSRKVGSILEQLFAEVLENPAKNTKEYLISRLKQLS